MKVLVTGTNGQLGYDVVKTLEYEDIECFSADRDIMDISNEEQVKKVITDYNPDVIIHCAAYTAVDKAEDEKELCYTVNVLGTKYVAEACKEINSKMVYISTDYVFNGKGNEPFEITDKPHPINYYGQTKYEGELEVQKLFNKYFIIRISWVFGSHGNNFVKTMLRLGKEKDEIKVVADQVGSPTYTYDLAKLILEMIQTEKYGIYHATNEGYCSWNEFASQIFIQANMDVKVTPITTDEYLTQAKRPKNSKLSKNSIDVSGFSRLRDYKEAINDFLKINNKVR